MIILYYSPENQTYCLQEVEQLSAFNRANESDVLHTFSKAQASLARKILANLNLAGLQAA